MEDPLREQTRTHSSDYHTQSYWHAKEPLARESWATPGKRGGPGHSETPSGLALQ